MTENQVKTGAGVGIGIAVGAIVLAALAILGLVLVGVIGILAAIAIPNFVTMQLKAKRSEVPGYVDGLKTAEVSYNAAFDGYVPVGSREEAEQQLRWNGEEPRAWEGGGDWEKLGWMPSGLVRGAYWVEVSSDGEHFTVYGLCDVDGDGVLAEYTATASESAYLITDRNTY